MRKSRWLAYALHFHRYQLAGQWRRVGKDNGVVPGFACAKSAAALFFEVAVYE
jgi:hypothetical protein